MSKYQFNIFFKQIAPERLVDIELTKKKLFFLRNNSHANIELAIRTLI